MPQAPWNYPHAFDTMPPSHVPPTHGSVAHLQNLSALNALSNTFPPMPAAAPPALRPSSLHPPPSALTGVGLGSLPAATAPTYGAMMGAVPQAAVLPPARKPPKVVTNTSELLECMQADEEQQKASEEAKGGVRPSAGMLAPRLSATSYRPDDLRSLNRLASHPPLTRAPRPITVQRSVERGPGGRWAVGGRLVLRFHACAAHAILVPEWA